MYKSGKFHNKLGIPEGVEFPTATYTADGDLFYRTDLENAYMRRDGSWVTITEKYTVTSINSTDSPYSAGSEDAIIINASGGPVTVDLPVLSGILGIQYHLKCISSGNVVTIDGAGASTIDGNITVTMAQYDSISLLAGSLEWHIM